MRSKPDASIVLAARAVADGRADALVSAGSTGPDARRRDAPDQAPARRAPARRSRCCCPIPGGPVLLLDAGASVEARPEHLVQFAYMGACFMEAVYGHGAPARRPAVGRRGVGQGHARGAHRARAHRGGRRPQLRRQRRGLRPARRAAPTWWSRTASPGNVALKVLEGTSRLVREAIAERGALEPRVGARRPADPRPRGAAARASSTRRRWAARSCSACASRWWWPTAASGRAGSPARSGLARRAVDEDMVGRTAAALEAAGALRSAPAGSVAEVTPESDGSA